MERLFNFVYYYRAFFIFLLLEILCSWMIVANNQYQSSSFFNSSNSLAAKINSSAKGVREYFSLRNINRDLAEENASLRKRLEQRNQSLYQVGTREITDPRIINRYDFISAKVTNNSVDLFKNFLTLDKGRDAGIEPGMAVISNEVVVGKVKSVSEHYAVVISLLNIDEQVSCIIRRTGYFGTAQWDGTNPRMIQLRYIPRHVKVQVGDTVVTSGYNAVFPKGILVGVIRKFNLKEEALFYDIQVELGQDFGNLAFAEVVKSNLRFEKDSLERITIGEPK